MSGTDYQIHRQTRQKPQAPQAWRAEVTRAPATAEDLAAVRTVHSAAGGVFSVGEASWPKPAGKALPEVGDECLVILDETRSPWIVAWAEPNWGH